MKNEKVEITSEKYDTNYCIKIYIKHLELYISDKDIKNQEQDAATTQD
jgi:hypothetical protein